jgi:hypothetical protein
MGRLTPDMQGSRMSGAEPSKVETTNCLLGGRTLSDDAADHRNEAPAGETVQLCLMPIDDDQRRKDPESREPG